ncbi:MAG: glycosyltransferase family 4 protein [Solirubrobacterales bacterium]
MRVLIFHGWLLRGTGSNVYNASLARAVALLGHEVHLLCQDRDPPDLGAGTAGSVTIHNPDIGGLLPVFVRDTYEGFDVKTFGELTEDELAHYIEANVDAVRELLDALGGVDAALANHLIMAPVILARAGLRYAIKIHGSDLSYTILPDLERFGRYAEEGAASANGILVGSGHIEQRLRLAVDDPETNAKVRLGPPGVDTDLFAPLSQDDRAGRLLRLADELARSPIAKGAWERDAQVADDAARWLAEPAGPRVVFVGKLIVSKGIDLLLAAWPLVHAAHPGARLIVVGFGAAEDAIRRAWTALEAGDLAPLRDIAERGRGVEGGEEGRLPILFEFLDGLQAGYLDMAREAAGSVRFAGRLEHDEVGRLVPACDALVFPSTFPEAFGMVAAEAASAGLLPISAAHSGAAEVSAALAENVPASCARLLSFPVDRSAATAIADRLDAWLSLPDDDRIAIGAMLRETVVRLWSWEGVANTVLAASAGELDRLRAPASPA